MYDPQQTQRTVFKAKSKKQALLRLETLRERAGKEIPANGFRMDRYVSKFDRKHNCGFICCLVGWLPALFPDAFKWINVAGNFVVKLLGAPSFDFKAQVQNYFGITENAFNYMFAGRALYDVDGKQLFPAVVNMRNVSIDQALRRVDNVIRLMRQDVGR